MALLPVVAGLILFGLFFSLGRWQLDRAAEKEQLLLGFDSADDAPAQRGPIGNEAAERQRYARMTVFGSYAGDRQILLDNMVSDGRAGYQVLTPLVLPGEQRMLLVNRGWIPMSADRRVLPEPEAGVDDQQVYGRIGRLPVAGLRAGSGLDPTETGWPRRAQFPTFEELESALGVELFHYVLLLDPDQPDGYVRDWRPAVMPASRHRGYAVQWFAMAATVIILFLVLFLKNYRRKPNE